MAGCGRVRDIVMAAMLGAEEYGIGTAALIAMGCIMVRQCQSNTCPVGVCTQNEALRQKFTGSADKVVNLITFYAQEVREILAQIGARSMDEIIGRADLLTQVSRGAANLDDLDLNPLLITVDGAQKITYDRSKPRNAVPTRWTRTSSATARASSRMARRCSCPTRSGTPCGPSARGPSSHIVKKFGMRNALQPDHLTVKLTGSCGQSLGAFSVRGLKLEVQGDANDYVGKGLSGGTITVRPLMSSPLKAEDNTIIGNTVLYGATDGFLFASGRAGERFAVRNSGASVVVEGCGSNGCEYMTGGVAVILGRIGANFGAGMTGGMAYVYDPKGVAEDFMNLETILTSCCRTPALGNAAEGPDSSGICDETAADRGTHSGELGRVERLNFLQVCPKEMVSRLAYPLSDEVAKVPAE
jgi:glutamate synthase (NADPH) large chain